MAQLLVVILHEPAQLPTLLEAWQTLDLPGVTILDSAGGYRTSNWLQKMGLSSIGDLFTAHEARSKALLAVIEDNALLEAAISTAEMVLGSFDGPRRGLLFVIPLRLALGVRRQPEQPAGSSSQPQRTMSDVELITRSTPISVVNDIMNLEPILVAIDTPLLEVAEAMVRQPTVNIACVVNQHQQLVGLIALRDLADDLFMLVIPEEFLAETRELDDAMHFARLSFTQTAGDAMQRPVSVTMDETLREAFQLMHRHKLSGLPIINQKQEVTGYISLLELMALYARSQSSSNQEEAPPYG